MINRIIFFFLCAVLASKAYGQVQSDSQKIPLLIQIDETSRPLKIEIPCACITDSLEVVISLTVHFDNEVSDTAKLLTPIYIYVGNIVYHRGSPQQVNLSRNEDLKSSFDLCIWETCSEKFLMWMKEQPYSQFYNRENQPKGGGKGLSFAYKAILIPKTL